jgi:hypothetical protein
METIEYPADREVILDKKLAYRDNPTKQEAPFSLKEGESLK